MPPLCSGWRKRSWAAASPSLISPRLWPGSIRCLPHKGSSQAERRAPRQTLSTAAAELETTKRSFRG